MRRILLTTLLLSLWNCQEKPEFKGHPIYKNIASDSALYYYELGWKQIMDEGNYGPAEISYRNALEHDANFLIGKAVLGRLTLDLEERLQIQKELEDDKDAITGDERLIFDVYAALVNFTNARAQKSSDTKKILRKAFRLAEENLGEVTRKYPNEIYMKAEYIEFLHARYGPRNTLDSLKVLTTEVQKENPFLLGFAASMNAEMDNFEVALEQAHRLKEITTDARIPKPYAVLADVYFQMDSLELAKTNANIAHKLDPRNLDASRLKEKIEKKLSDKK
jgi:tetratricopeptide (TPR) repeat protein